MPIKTNSIPWLRIGAETVAIVGSILLAFAIDAWWDLRGEREQEQEYLVALQAEVQSAWSELDADLRSRQQLRIMLAGFLSGETRDLESLTEVLQAASIVNNLSPPTAVIDELISSGQLHLIQSAEIREGLILYRQMMQKNDLNDEGQRAFVNSRFIPFLSDKVPLTGLVRSASEPGSGLQPISDQDWEVLRTDYRFTNILIERLHHLDRGLPRLEATTNHLAALSELVVQASL